MTVKSVNTAFYTYLHCKPNGDPFYVGKGSFGRSHSNRSREFKRARNPHHKSIVQKYGAENIQVFVFPCESEHQALADEVQQIAQLRRAGFRLSNVTDGGEGVCGWVATTETRAKMSAMRLGKKRPKEFSKTMSLAKTGKKFTKEHRENLSLAKIGRPSSKKGVPISAEQKAKISFALKGRVSNRKGVRVSDETRAKMSAGQLRRFSCQ